MLRHVENLVDLACRTAIGYRGVAHITFPTDLQEQELSRKQASSRNLPHHTSDVGAQSARLPSPDDLRSAADVLNAGKKVAILAGQGALRAGDQLEAVAEKLGAPIVKALLGKAAVPDDSPYTTGGIGLLGTKPSQTALEECDTVLIVGSSFPYIEFMPKPGKARGVQIEIDPRRIGLRYPVEVGLVGDCRRVLDELLPLLQRKDDRDFLEEAQKGMAEWQAKHAQAGRADGRAHEAAGDRLRNSAEGFPPPPLFLATPAPTRPGGPATFRRSAARCIPVPATWRAWLPVCRTPSPRRSPIPSGSAWPSSAMAASPC